jgi:hypothetical protein
VERLAHGAKLICECNALVPIKLAYGHFGALIGLGDVQQELVNLNCLLAIHECPWRDPDA